ncbi:hypothetical protein KSB_76210 [Ktedonobacter robiniae]|uniref:DUF1254 domain-containing protein n=1 Tax=Ktedonobacter robiniae TaxID=2778365 RepID=A0ABQ3V2F8_9CHLR|nr:hypothetical protein KSB_76210 [Ktedonobacter robiniae]
MLYIGGWLDLSKGPQVLHVPDMAGRYYSVQFTEIRRMALILPTSANAPREPRLANYLISVPGWKGTVSQGMTQISSPNNSVLVMGRVFVESDSDLPTAYGLAKQIQLTPLSH